MKVEEWGYLQKIIIISIGLPGPTRRGPWDGSVHLVLISIGLPGPLQDCPWDGSVHLVLTVFIRFRLNFKPSESSDDVLFLLYANFRERVLLRNSILSHGNRGAEERDVSYFPFRQGKCFQMLILCEADMFKVCPTFFLGIRRLFRHTPPI